MGRPSGIAIAMSRHRSSPTPSQEAIDLDSSLTDMAASKANTNIIGHAGRLLALEEGHFPYVLDGGLETVGPLDFGGKLKGSFTAHPKVCPVTGELLGFGYSLFEPYLAYLRVSAAGELVQVENITVGGPTMMHDFNVTRNYVIFMDLPAVFDLDMAIRGEMPIHWSDSYPARLGVMPRNGSDADVKWYDIDPCYVFHPMNAYEDGNKIVIDVARLDHIWRDSPMDFPAPSLYRWTIDTATGKVHEEQIDDLPAEFPRVADSVVGLKHRYGYMMANATESAFEEPLSAAGAILKYDRESGTRSQIDVGQGRLPGETVFVPSADGTAEDDGYLMTYVYNAANNESDFMIFDASSMSSEPVATVHLPRVPFGFHGNWVAASVAD